MKVILIILLFCPTLAFAQVSTEANQNQLIESQKDLDSAQAQLAEIRVREQQLEQIIEDNQILVDKYTANIPVVQKQDAALASGALDAAIAAQQQSLDAQGTITQQQISFEYDTVNMKETCIHKPDDVVVCTGQMEGVVT